MTPFGVKIRDWRQRKKLTLYQQANTLGVSAAYLSALETGARGRPSAKWKIDFYVQLTGMMEE